MGQRGPEERQHRLADELLDDAAEALDLLPGGGLVRDEARAKVLRIGGGETDKLGGEDGDELSLLAHRLRAHDGLAVLDLERVEPLGLAQVLEPALADVAQRKLTREQLAGRLREEHLAALGGAHDPGGAVDVEAGEELAVARGLARVKPDADAEGLARPRMGGMGALGGGGRLDRLARARKGEVEAVALHLDLDSPMRRAGVAQEPPVRVERLDVALAAQRLEQLRRALDVGEEEGDCAGGELGH